MEGTRGACRWREMLRLDDCGAGVWPSDGFLWEFGFSDGGV